MWSHRDLKIRDLAQGIVASLGHGAPDTPFDPQSARVGEIEASEGCALLVIQRSR